MIDLESNVSEPTDDLVRPMSPQSSSSIISASPLPSSVSSSPMVGGPGRFKPNTNVVIPPEAKDEVIIISNNETTLVLDEETTDAEEEDNRTREDVSPDMSHVSVVVVGDENIQVVDSSSVVSPSSPQPGGIETNGAGELSDLSRSFSSASHTSSESGRSKDSSSFGNGFNNSRQQHLQSSNRSSGVTSPTSIILEGSTITETETDETPTTPSKPPRSPSARQREPPQTKPQSPMPISPLTRTPNGHIVGSPISDSSEEDSGIQAKSLADDDHHRRGVPEEKRPLQQGQKTRHVPPPPPPESPEPSNNKENNHTPIRKTRRAMSENVVPSHHFKQQQQQHHQEDEAPVELRRKKKAEEDAIKEEPSSSSVLQKKDDNVVGSAVTRKTPLTKEDIAKMNLKKKTRKRTRKFEIDGVVVTTTTSKVIYGDDENDRYYDEHYFRKQELRELKLLQKQEQKQFQDLAFKNQVRKCK